MGTPRFWNRIPFLKPLPDKGASPHETQANAVLRPVVFGANDGLVSNLALVMGDAGANPAPGEIVLAGVAGLLAGAFSMAVGEYISVRSQRELLAASHPGPSTVPALPYLDVLRAVREHSTLPLGAYNVSGEYSMLHAAADRGMIDRNRAMMEVLTSIRRAGADFILTYHALAAAELLGG